MDRRQITFKHWNKNKGNEQEFYKGKHYNSIGPIQHKIGAVIGTFKRIDRNCSNIKLFQEAIEEKAQELILHLGYPKKLILNILSTGYLLFPWFQSIMIDGLGVGIILNIDILTTVY